MIKVPKGKQLAPNILGLVTFSVLNLKRIPEDKYEIDYTFNQIFQIHIWGRD